MKRFACILALFLGTVMIGRSATNPVGSSGPLYITIESQNPAILDRLQRTDNKKEFLNDSLREAAPAMASAANWASEIIVLPQDQSPPAGEQVLRFTFNGDVQAEYLTAPDAKPYFIGKVSDLSLATHHPDPYVLRHRIDPATLDDRPVIRRKIELEMELYVSLQRIEKHLAKG